LISCIASTSIGLCLMSSLPKGRECAQSSRTLLQKLWEVLSFSFLFQLNLNLHDHF
jgi:hypothetical protein